MKKIILYAVVIILPLTILASNAFAKQKVRHNKLYPISSGEIINHPFYSLAYCEEYEGAYWVFYKLTKDLTEGTAERKDNFKPDPFVPTGSATPDDYKGSGYDKGHLCPAADMKLEQSAMDETFYMSNMSPQFPALNRQTWRFLEEKVRDWCNACGQLYVATGPIFTNVIEVIGENEVAVPGAYYKIIWDGKDRMIGFIMPNEKCTKPIQDYVVSVDSIEEVTNIDFFSKIPNRKEKIFEAEVAPEKWGF